MDEDGLCQVGAVSFHLVGVEGMALEERGVLSITVETDTPGAEPGSTHDINGLKWHVRAKGGAIPPAMAHPNGAIGIQKLEHNPVEAWSTLTQLVHTVLPPPTRAMAWKNPSGDAQHVALWDMEGQEVFEMADGMGHAVMQRGEPVPQDEIGMLFFVVADSAAAAAAIGEGKASEPAADGRKGFALNTKELGISINVVMMMEPEEPAPAPKL